jgi:hypothetical protein
MESNCNPVNRKRQEASGSASGASPILKHSLHPFPPSPLPHLHLRFRCLFNRQTPRAGVGSRTWGATARNHALWMEKGMFAQFSHPRRTSAPAYSPITGGFINCPFPLTDVLLLWMNWVYSTPNHPLYDSAVLHEALRRTLPEVFIYPV